MFCCLSYARDVGIALCLMSSVSVCVFLTVCSVYSAKRGSRAFRGDM